MFKLHKHSLIACENEPKTWSFFYEKTQHRYPQNLVSNNKFGVNITVERGVWGGGRH